MIKTRTLYKEENKTANRLITSEYDIVNRTGTMTLTDEIKLMDKAGQIYNNYVEKVYKDVIGKGENQILENGKNTMQYKEVMDMIDDERRIHDNIKENKEKINKLKIEREEIERLASNDILANKEESTTDNK